MHASWVTQIKVVTQTNFGTYAKVCLRTHF